MSTGSGPLVDAEPGDGISCSGVSRSDEHTRETDDLTSWWSHDEVQLQTLLYDASEVSEPLPSIALGEDPVIHGSSLLVSSACDADVAAGKVVGQGMQLHTMLANGSIPTAGTIGSWAERSTFDGEDKQIEFLSPQTIVLTWFSLVPGGRVHSRTMAPLAHLSR